MKRRTLDAEQAMSQTSPNVNVGALHGARITVYSRQREVVVAWEGHVRTFATLDQALEWVGPVTSLSIVYA